MTASKLEDLFLMALKDIYHGEKQIARCWRMPVGGLAKAFSTKTSMT